MKRNHADMTERRENILRPSRYLGYDRDQLGMHLMSREAYAMAESQFRRAVWLNPFEPAFREHLAWCLFRQKRYEEAITVVREAMAVWPGLGKLAELGRLIDGRMKEGGAPRQPPRT